MAQWPAQLPAAHAAFTFAGPLIPSAPANLTAALGKNDQKIYAVPSLGLVVIRQGQAAGDSKLASSSSFDTVLWACLMAAFCSTVTAATPANTAGGEVFPNPGTGLLTLRQPTTQAATLRLFDALGRVACTQPAAPETQVSGAALAPGL